MNKRSVFGALMALALLLMPGISHARLYNGNTGRFMTMDTFQGRNEDPSSLHKYLYVADNPVNAIDPSGHDLVEELVTENVDADLESSEGEAIGGAVKRGLKAKTFEFDLGFQWGAGSGGWGPHSFLYVPNKLTGNGLKYDVASNGALIVENYPKNVVQGEAWFGKLFHIADFNLFQYMGWTASTWVVAEGVRNETQLLDEQWIRSLGLAFSYTFLPGTINCFKWTLVAGVEGYGMSKVGN